MATDRSLTADGRARLAAFRAAGDLTDLVSLTGADSEHEAYFEARREWRTLRDRELPSADPTTDRLPGDCVVVDGHQFWVHGVTHADTDSERAFLRDHVEGFLDSGATVYCEQGIRPMYFEEFPGVCAMDDYRWALAECEKLDIESHLDSTAFDGVLEDVTDVAARFREVTYSLIHAGEDVYGAEFATALGDVASDFLMSHEDIATGRDFASFTMSRRAAEHPELLGELQRYYKCHFLPQPIEREWLRRHDPELELVSHARNERMTDYAVVHNRTAEQVHLIVGAAHQPGVVYYLEEHRDGTRRTEDFELVE